MHPMSDLHHPMTNFSKLLIPTCHTDYRHYRGDSLILQSKIIAREYRHHNSYSIHAWYWNWNYCIPVSSSNFKRRFNAAETQSPDFHYIKKIVTSKATIFHKTRWSNWNFHLQRMSSPPKAKLQFDVLSCLSLWITYNDKEKKNLENCNNGLRVSPKMAQISRC